MRDAGQAPSGAQVEIAHGEQRATITEVGATLRAYSSGGLPVIEGFAEGEICTGGRGQVLLPWPNRIRAGFYQHGGRRHQLPVNDVEHGAAIHGLARWQPWRLADRSSTSVRFELRLFPQPGYPFRLELEATYSLGPGGLRVELGGANAGAESAPFGSGSHPYLHPGATTIDEVLLMIPARSTLEVDDRLIPTGRRVPVAGTEYDYRQPRPVGATAIDVCFTDLDEPRVRFGGTELWWDGGHGYLQVFSGDSLAPERRRRGLAVEPMSCAPDAFNSGAGLVVLDPGERWSGVWGIRPRDLLS